MASVLQVEELRGSTTGANANKIIIPSGQTLDASAGGVELPAGVGGKVLNVWQEVISDRPVMGNTSWATIAGVNDSFEITVTPTNANSKFLLECKLHVGSDTRYGGFRFYADASPIGVGDAAASPTTVSFTTSANSSESYHEYRQTNGGMTYLHSPSTTNSITYSVKHAIVYGSGYTKLNTSWYEDYNNTYTMYAISTFTVTEIAG